MRKNWFVWSIPVVMLGLLGWANLSLAQEKGGNKQAEPPKKAEPAKPAAPKAETPKAAEKDIVDTAKAAADMKTLVTLLDKAGLVEELKGKGPFTVFAPTDEAFKKLGAKVDELQKPEKKAELRTLLQNHIVKGKVMAADLKTKKDIQTLGGAMLKVDAKGAVMIETAKVTKADVAAGNGVIHVIDGVIQAGEKPVEKPPVAKPADKPGEKKETKPTPPAPAPKKEP